MIGMQLVRIDRQLWSPSEFIPAPVKSTTQPIVLAVE